MNPKRIALGASVMLAGMLAGCAEGYSQKENALPGFEAFQRAWGDRPNPPIVTAAFVAGLGHPDFLVEIDAVAVVPEE